MSIRKNIFELLLVSFAALFLELVIIRWLSTEVRIFAYFKNLTLMAAFLGFGVGCFFHRNADALFYRWFPRLVGCLVIIIALAPLLGITHVIFVDPREYFLLGVGFGDHEAESAPSLYQTIKALFVIVSLFSLVTATFAALTSKMGELLNMQKPLFGYSINVVGSLLGIGGFSLVSYLEWSPAVWLCVVYVSLFYFYLGRSSIMLAGIYFLASLAVTAYVGKVIPRMWSPYYQIYVQPLPDGGPYGKHIFVNYDGFQTIRLLSDEYMKTFPESIQRTYSRHYNIPYRLGKRNVDSVLILGGGTGNDAAAALRNGAKVVDVVEIDPVIARLGRELHPEKPYASENVNLFVEDARPFLHRTGRKYDLVVFATLDSHAAFSSLSSIRLDNFVFTKESIQNARMRLKPEGGIAINFFAINPWVSQRHFNTLKDAMGVNPVVFGSTAIQEILLLAGDLFDSDRDLGITNYQAMSTPFTPSDVEPTTDDWPFLFLEKRGIPFHYLLPLFLIFALALIPFRYCQLRVAHVNWHLFFMGAAFLLIETKAVTTLGLIFGSTWMVNSIVIGSILIMILFANFLIASSLNVSFTSLYMGLFGTLIFNFLLPFDLLNSLSWGHRVLAGGIIISFPLFLAALIFAKAFARVESPSIALASNLFGALVGGLLEYLDMWLGLRWLNIIALSLYLISYLFLHRTEVVGFGRGGEFRYEASPRNKAS